MAGGHIQSEHYEYNIKDEENRPKNLNDRNYQALSEIFRQLKNSKCRLYGDRDETINRITSESSRLAQKEYKTRHGWVRRVINWELCKKS